MNIQIYGKAKCFDTGKAERYFKERGIAFQRIDLLKYPPKGREFDVILAAVGLDALIDVKSRTYESSFIAYLASKDAKIEKLLEMPALFRTPIVRNRKLATVGYCPDVWGKWE